MLTGLLQHQNSYSSIFVWQQAPHQGRKYIPPLNGKRVTTEQQLWESLLCLYWKPSATDGQIVKSTVLNLHLIFGLWFPVMDEIGTHAISRVFSKLPVFINVWLEKISWKTKQYPTAGRLIKGKGKVNSEEALSQQHVIWLCLLNKEISEVFKELGLTEKRQ